MPTDEFFKRIAESQEPLDTDAVERPTGTAARRVARRSTQSEPEAELEGSPRESALEEEGDAGEAMTRASLWPRQVVGAAAIAVVAVIATAALEGKQAKPSATKPAPAVSSVARVPRSAVPKRRKPRRPPRTSRSQNGREPPGRSRLAQTTAGRSGTTADQPVVGSLSPPHEVGAGSVEEFGFEGR